MEIILLIVLQVVVAFAILALVLVQQGKGSDVGAAFGSGASNTMFGSSGSTSFLMKVTMLLAAIFFCTSLGLNYVGAHGVKHATSKHGFLNLPSSQAPAATTASISKTIRTNTSAATKIAPRSHTAVHIPQIWNHKTTTATTSSNKKTNSK